MGVPVAVLRMGAADTALLCADAGPRGLRTVSYERVARPTLDPAGVPTPNAAAVVAALTEAAGLRAVTLALPPGAATLARVRVDVPAPGAVTGRTVEDALASARTAAAKPGQAILSCRPFAFEADGEPVDEAPLGRKVSMLGVDAVCLSASLSQLSAYERAVSPAALSGVVAHADALGAAFLPEGEGAVIRVGQVGTFALRMTNAAVSAQARVPVGRRHVEGDLAQAMALEPAEAARRADAVLSGTSSDDRAIGVVGDRLAELSDLLEAAVARAGLDLAGARLSGLPPRAAARVVGAAPAAMPDLPTVLRDDPVIGGAAMLLLGMRGGTGRAVLAKPERPSAWAWLKQRF